MELPVDFRDEAHIRRAFTWLTRIGAGPRFGSRPIGWYQIHQCHALDILGEMAPDGGRATCRKGVIRVGKVNTLTASKLYQMADERSRR